MEESGLPLPAIRCLTKDQAAAYLGIGMTLLAELDVPCIKFGRRCVYDVLDLDTWLEEYKQRGRAGKEKSLWPKTTASTVDVTPGTGGSVPRYRTADAYAKALGLSPEKKRKPCSPS